MLPPALDHALARSTKASLAASARLGWRASHEWDHTRGLRSTVASLVLSPSLYKLRELHVWHRSAPVAPSSSVIAGAALRRSFSARSAAERTAAGRVMACFGVETNKQWTTCPNFPCRVSPDRRAPMVRGSLSRNEAGSKHQRDALAAARQGYQILSRRLVQARMLRWRQARFFLSLCAITVLATALGYRDKRGLDEPYVQLERDDNN